MRYEKETQLFTQWNDWVIHKKTALGLHSNWPMRVWIHFHQIHQHNKEEKEEVYNAKEQGGGGPKQDDMDNIATENRK